MQEASSLLAQDPAAALERANGLAAQRPDPRVFRLAAGALRALGRNDEAAQAELQGIKFGFTPQLKLARAAQQARQSDEARSIADKYLEANPDDLLAMTIAAEAALGLRRSEEAEPMLRRVVERAPAFAPANLLLATIVAGKLHLREAAGILEALLELAPQEMSARRFLADLRAQMNEPARAAALYGELASSDAASPADQFKLAQHLRAAGQREESIAALRRTLGRLPYNGQAWSTLAHHFPEELTDEDERQIRAGIATPGIHTDDLRLLQVALSVIEDRRGNYEAAFAAIAASKALPSRTPPYDAEGVSRHVEELIASYTPEVFERFRACGSSSDAPIFVVGLPRSGSTLIERILGQHSKAEPIGEIPVMPRVVAAERVEGTAGYRSLLPESLNGEKLAEMADWYLQSAEQYRHTDKPRFIDKYNGNWVRAGLIMLMFPRAKIIDARRDPLDCCWSVFKTMFADDYARDMRHLARFYADYARFMDAMVSAAPDRVLTVRYEELVRDVDGETRRMLDFLDLPFEAACVDFHLSTAPVMTPSSEQVRRPISNESIGSAEPYRQWLQPLIDELESASGKSA